MNVRLALVLASALATLGCPSSATTSGPDDAGIDANTVATAKRRLFVGTGEYAATQDWHGILRFDDVSGTLAAQQTPTATIPIKETHDAAGVKLNFAHGFYYRAARDEMYVATLFTRADNVECKPCNPMDPAQPGSIAVLSSVRAADGAQVVKRHIFGGDDATKDKTRIVQPHGVWLDETRDLLYVANTFGDSLLVFENASTVDGNVAPTRVVTTPYLGHPVFAFVEPKSDRLFVASMAAATPAREPAIVIFASASKLQGDTAPNVRIAGPKTRLGAGNNQTTHNVWFDPASKLLFVGHHTNEVLVFNLAAVDLDQKGPVDLDLAPRVLDVSASDLEIPRSSVYGLFFVPEDDALYVSVGIAMGGPTPGSPPNSVKIYEHATSPSLVGRAAPQKQLTWSNGLKYFPPQPLWVERY